MLKPDELPDFEDMYRVSEAIKALQIERDLMKDKLEQGKEKVHQNAPKVDGKAPATSFIKSNFEYSGLRGELLPLREALIRLEAEADALQRKFDLMKMQVAVFQTISANKRASML